MQDGDLRVSEDGLTALADDLDRMQGHLERQIREMDRVVDSIAAGWQGPTATAYRALHRGAAEDAVRTGGSPGTASSGRTPPRRPGRGRPRAVSR